MPKHPKLSKELLGGTRDHRGPTNAHLNALKLPDGTTLVARHDDLDRIMRCMKACKDIPDSELDAGIVKTLYDAHKERIEYGNH